MRRGPLALIALLPVASLASAQTLKPVEPIPLFVASATTTQPLSPDVVVARVMSFDRDNDGRVSRDELPDRMHSLLSDAAGGSLDSATIRARATTAASAPATGRTGFPGGGYSFGDQFSLSSRPHMNGALDDLRLPANTREQADAIVAAFMQKLEADAVEALVADLHFVLTVSQLTSFRSEIERQLSGQFATNEVMQADGTKVQRIFVGRPDLSQRINGLGLPPAQTSQALATFASFKERIRPGEVERSALVEKLRDILSDEERDDFRAALERRPLVKSGLSSLEAHIVVRAERQF
jgi:hypothetical protein